MIGMKCRAPHVHEWGSMSYHNAIICGVEKPESVDSLPKVLLINTGIITFNKEV